MSCCLNPDCTQPINHDQSKFCQNCGVPMVSLLRNRFRILKPLGRGGFGKTYLAEDVEKFNEACVVKQLAYQGATSAAALDKVRELFEREAKQLQTLGEHSQIPGLLAYFEEGAYLYLVQQWVNGQTLQAELMQQGPFNDDKIRSVLSELLSILQFVHQNGIVHRDLKPENIIRDQETQRLVLIDFGVSKVLSSSVQSSVGTMLGSHGYAPLEQLLEGKASPASDLFSLGATCFHLLSNTAPHQLSAASGYRWSQHWQKYLPQGFQPQTISILNKLLQVEVSQRYQTCEQVLEDLISTNLPATEVVSHPPTPAPSPSTPPTSVNTPVPTKPRSNKVLLGGIAIAALIGVPLVWALMNSPQSTVIDPSDPIESQPIESQPVDPQPVDPQPIESQGTDSTPTEVTAESSNQLDRIDVIELPSPDFRRSPPQDTGSAVGLTQISAEPNQITDTTAWFQKHQLSLPTYTVPNPFQNEFGNLPSSVEPKIGNDVVVKAIRGNDNLLLLYGPNYSGGTRLYGYDEASGTYLYGFDFSQYTFAPDNDPADLDFVEQRINWAQQDGNILYVSHGHRTYARSSRGMNAYITAIDLDTKTPRWTSQALVANAQNFLVLDKYLITGYGFTDEADYLYLLDKETGAVVNSKPLETSPEYILRKGDRLFVRGYNTDYEFQRQSRNRP